jgi:hypothetical protein
LEFEGVKDTLPEIPTTGRGYVMKVISTIEEYLEDHVQPLQGIQAS